MYANSRMLYGLAVQGHASKIFKSQQTRGSNTCCYLFFYSDFRLCIAENDFIPEEALSYLMYMAVAASF